jgi:glutaconate CoA-transferase subunit B
MCPHRPERLVERVRYITSPGFLGGGDERERAGLTGGGPRMIITDLAVFRFDPVTKRAFVGSVHPGVDPELVVERAGFAVELGDGVATTPEPGEDALLLLRTMDPNEMYLKRPKERVNG